MSQENVEIMREAYEHFNRAGEPPWGALRASDSGKYLLSSLAI
jgi:hypothetical protein